MGDLLEDAVWADLGTRRPGAWVSTAGPIIERDTVKQQRRANLASGSAFNSGQEDGSSPGRRRKDGEIPVHLVLRRRDEHHHLPASQRSSRASRSEAIAQQLKMKMEPLDATIPWLDREDEAGAIEYKFKLNNPHPLRLQQLITQLKFRLSEGAGQCFYYLGVEDDGYPKGLGAPELDASIANLHKMAHTLNSVASVVRIFPGAHGRSCALVRVQRALLQEVGYLDLRMAVAGCVDAGKSTLVAVLTHGSGGAPTLDSGRGSARVAVLRHKHEIETGRTSSLSHQFLGYDAEGRVLNYTGTSAPSLAEVCGSAARLLTFIDMGGHRKCLKTALYGLTALLPDYALLCCCGMRGLGRVSTEHLAVAVALQIPVAVVITKVDLVDASGLAGVVQDIRNVVALAWPAINTAHQDGGSDAAATSRPGALNEVQMQQVSPLITDTEAAEQAADKMGQMHMHAQECVQGVQGSQRAATAFTVPIFPVSCVTGQGIDVLHAFLRSVQPSQVLKRSQVPPAKSVASVPDLSTLCRGVAVGSNGSALEATVGDSKLHPSCPATTQTTAFATAQGTAPTATGLAAQPTTVQDHAAATQMPSLTEWANPAVLAAQAGAQADSVQQHLMLHEAAADTTASSAAPQEIHFQVDQMFEVAGVGSVVSGMTLTGDIQLGQRMLLGPNTQGHFTQVEITGIQRAHIPVHVVRAGQCATLAMQPVVDGTSVRAGDALLQQALRLSSSGGATLDSPGRDGAAAEQQLDATADAGAALSAAAVGIAVQTCSKKAVGALNWPGQTGVAGTCTPVDDSGTEGAGQAASTKQQQQQRSLSRLGLQLSGEGTWGSSSDGMDAGGTPVRACSPDAHPPAPAGELSDAPRPTAGLIQAAAPAAAPAAAAVAAPLAIASPGTMDVSPDLLELFDMCDDDADEGRGGDGLGGGMADLFGGDDTPATSNQHAKAKNKTLGHKPAYSVPDLNTSVSPPEFDTRHTLVPGSLPGQACQHQIQPGEPVIRQRPLGQQSRSMPTGQEEYEHLQRQQLKFSRLVGQPAASCMLATSPSSAVHRGAVLLGPGQNPATIWSFEAVLVLLAGHWPARGLISGSWPPVQDAASNEAEPGAGGLPVLPLGKPAGRAAGKLVKVDSSSAGSRTASITADSRSNSDVDSLSTSRPRDRMYGSPGWLWASSQGNSSAATPPAGCTPGAISGPGSPMAVSAHVMTRDDASPGRQNRPQRQGHIDGEVADEGQEGQGRRRHRRRKTRGVHQSQYTCVIHCANIRQLARLVSMQELQPAASTATASQPVEHVVPEVRVMPSMRAAAALLHAPWQPRAPHCALHYREDEEEAGGSRPGGDVKDDAGAEEAGDHPDLGCIVKAVFRFDHRPEWLTVGSRLVVRDRTTGHVSAAGYVSALVPAGLPQ